MEQGTNNFERKITEIYKKDWNTTRKDIGA